MCSKDLDLAGAISQMGSLRARVELQHQADLYVLIADLQALSDPADAHAQVAANVVEIALVPVDSDQVPMIEQTNELVRHFNASVGQAVLLACSAQLSAVPRLPGIDGKAKMSKSPGNAIALAASPQDIHTAVNRMYTDPGHLRASAPGVVESHVVFAFLDAFDPDTAELAELKAAYRRGGLGDRVLKGRLEERLQGLIAPMRERRASHARDRGAVLDRLAQGTLRARHTAADTLGSVRRALGLCHFG